VLFLRRERRDLVLAPEPGADRILKAPPKERLSPDDRASLDRLVHSRAR